MNRRAAARTPLAPSSSKSYLPVGSGRDKTGGLLVAEAKFVNIHGERIAVRDEGAGEALLLIHGMAGSSQTWRAILPQLAKSIG